MIRYVSGDLLQSKASLIAHGVAPNDNFGQGLALALRENWPATAGYGPGPMGNASRTC